jgi:SAM-dependent methyltransferase
MWMEHVVNTEQAQAWNGPEGVYWADHQDRWNAINQGFNEHLLPAAAIGARDHVLDVGCGAGQTTRLAARQATAGQVLGLDLSGPMLARARALAAAEGLRNVTFEQGDAQAHPLPAGAFDVAISRFGVMFFSDPVAAFARIGSALRPGGRLAFVCVGDPSRTMWLRLFTAIRPWAELPDFSPGAPGMFSLADPDTVRRVLTEAGYAAVRVTAVEATGTWGRDAADAADFLLGGGIGQHVLTGADEASRAQARSALVDAARAYEGPDGVRVRGGAWLVTATRPADEA